MRYNLIRNQRAQGIVSVPEDPMDRPMDRTPLQEGL